VAGPASCPSIPDFTDESEDSMETQCSVSGISRILSNGVSTPISGSVPRKDRMRLLNQLRTRRADPNLNTPDENIQRFKSAFGIQKAINIPFKDTKVLQTILRDFLGKYRKASPMDNSYTAIEDLFNEINKWKPTCNLATITNREFENDIEHCRHSNEAVFQRTVMLSIIDRWQLDTMFDFNCEGHWSLQGNYPLPSTQLNDTISGPKPDLAIFFKFGALIGRDAASPFPRMLQSCIWPDRYLQRCFPFVFIEAKRGFVDLEFAVYANMHSASQALFNIYQWMERAGRSDIFFRDVRVFSIAINAQQIIARVHRAKPLDEGKDLEFLCHELPTLYGYNRDEACLLIRNILVEYGVKELHGILKATFEEVSRRYKEGKIEDSEPPKRKNVDMPAPSTKKARNSQTASQQTIDPSSSFGASRIDLGDD
jgi:hypothetical protein